MKSLHFNLANFVHEFSFDLSNKTKKKKIKRKRIAKLKCNVLQIERNAITTRKKGDKNS